MHAGRVGLHVVGQAGELRLHLGHGGGDVETLGQAGTAGGRQREVAEAEPAHGREVHLVGRPLTVVGEVRRLVAAPQQVELAPGESAVVTGATGPSLTNTALPSPSCPVTTLRTSIVPPRFDPAGTYPSE